MRINNAYTIFGFSKIPLVHVNSNNKMPTNPFEINLKTLNQTYTIAATKFQQTHLKSKPKPKSKPIVDNKIPISQTHTNPFQINPKP